MEEFKSLEEIEAEYLKFSNILIGEIKQREELRGLLKIAKPEEIAEIRKRIAFFDKSIENSEQYLESLEQIRAARAKLDTRERGLFEIMEKMKPDLLKYIAENHPEKMAEMEELFVKEYPPSETTH